MVNGRLARACAPSAGVALLLLAACGGRSVATVGDDAGAGGTTGGGASSGGASSGGAVTSSGGTSTSSSGGTGGSKAGSAGVAGDSGGRPSHEMLNDGCTTICGKAVDAACDGFEYGTCLVGCFQYAAVADKTTACSRTVFEYFYCVENLPDICALSEAPDLACKAGSDASLACVLEYCQTHERDEACAEPYP